MTLNNQETTNWIKHLQKESSESYNAALDLYKSKKYNFALFFCHLSVEKIVKACHISKNNVFAQPVHDLLYLIKKSGITVDKNILTQLAEINTFNIRARYDDYKREFYKKATVGYTKKWIEITSNLLKIFSINL